jgi:hypothetical protein
MYGRAFSRGTAMTARQVSQGSVIDHMGPLALWRSSRPHGDAWGASRSRLALLQREPRNGDALLCDGDQLLSLAHAHHSNAQAFFRSGDAILVAIRSLRVLHSDDYA